MEIACCNGLGRWNGLKWDKYTCLGCWWWGVAHERSAICPKWVKMTKSWKSAEIMKKTQRNNEVMTKYRDKGEWEGLTQLHFTNFQKKLFWPFFALFQHPYVRPLVSSGCVMWNYLSWAHIMYENISNRPFSMFGTLQKLAVSIAISKQYWAVWQVLGWGWGVWRYGVNFVRSSWNFFYSLF